MSDQGRVGVVIVNFNSGDYLERCVRSLCASDTSLTIAIVDNLSSDNSLEQIKDVDSESHDLKIIKNTANLGFSKAVNIGVSNIDCELILILNPDCQVHAHSVRKLSKTFSEHPNAGIVGALVFNEDGTEQRGCRRNEPTILRSMVTTLGLGRWFEAVDLTSCPLPQEVLAVDAISGAAMMVRSSCFSEIGGMDEAYFLHCEDLDVCRRMRDSGYQVMFNPDVSIFHRQGASGGTNFTRTEKLKHQGMMIYYEKHATGSLLSQSLAKVLVTLHYYTKVILQGAKSRTSSSGNRDSRDAIPDFNLAKDYILVSGVNTDVGDFLLHDLSQDNKEFIAVGRSPAKLNLPPAVNQLTVSYFTKAPFDDLPVFSHWVHLAPIWTGTTFESAFKRQQPNQIIALSSTSLEVKSQSSDVGESRTVELLRQGESWFSEYAHESNCSLTIFRPTLIYGGHRNRSINLVRRVVKLFRVFPLVGPGSGKRQPIHARDVAAACVAVLGNYKINGALNIAGNEVVTYKQMVERVFRSTQVSPKFVEFPLSVITVTLWVICRIPGLGMFTPQMAQRMSQDQVFSIDPVLDKLAWQPGDFEP